MVYRGTWGRDPEKKGEDVFPLRFVGPLMTLDPPCSALVHLSQRSRKPGPEVFPLSFLFSAAREHRKDNGPGSAWGALAPIDVLSLILRPYLLDVLYHCACV